MGFFPTLGIDLALGGNYAAQVWADGAVGYWRLGERNGSVVYDSSNPALHGFGGSPANGSYIGGVTLGQPGLLTDNNSAAKFDGSTGYVLIPNQPVLDTTAPNFPGFSFECLINSTTVPVDGFYRNFVELGTGQFSLFRLDGVLRVSLEYSDTTTSDGHLNFTLGAGGWYHVVVTHDGANTKLYVNGSLSSTYAKAFPIFARIGNSLAIGSGHATPTTWVDATIDEVAIYNVVLTPTQIGNHVACYSFPWTPVTVDTRAARGLSLKYGIGDGGATSLVADTGEARWYMDNSAKNFAGQQSYYSPASSHCRGGFKQGIPARIKFTYSGVPYYKFVGRVKDIVPLPGIHEEQSTLMTAVDYMDELAEAVLTAGKIPPILNATIDQVVQSLLTAMNSWPTGTSIDAGIGSWPYALIAGTAGKVDPLSEVQRAATSECRGYVYMKGDTTAGGVLRVENRHYRPQTITPASTLTDTNLFPGMEQLSSTDDIINHVEATFHRRRIDPAPVVLYSAATVYHLGPLATASIFAAFRDPTQTVSVDSWRVAGVSMVPPAATTDYLGNSAADGTGADLTASLTVSAAFAGTGAVITVVNTSLSDVYLVTTGAAPMLQLRGYGLYDYDSPVVISEDISSQNQYGSHNVPIDLTYESSQEVAQGGADDIRSDWSNPVGYVTRVVFLANDTDASMTMALAREPGDLISVTETVTGISGKFFINAVEFNVSDGIIIWCTWTLAPYPALTYCILDAVGYAELDSNAHLRGI